MSDASERLEEARTAFARREWSAARDAFHTASEAVGLSATDRSDLARCHWLLGDAEVARHHLEEAHRAGLDEDDAEAAAMAALELGIMHLLRGDEPIGSGWIGRAGRLADDLSESRVHGYLTFVLEVQSEFTDVDPAGVVDAARRVQAIGRRHGDPTLVASGLHGEGRVLIGSGRVAEGMALLDEAMVAVLAGEVDDNWAGSLYCATVATCHHLGDLHRMARWTEAIERWVETLPDAALFAGDCRVHRAQLFLLRGHWDDAEEEAARACEELADVSVGNTAEAWYELGEVRRRRGDLRGAEAAYEAAHAHGLDPQPGLALLRLAQGRTGTAAAALRAALLAPSGDRLRRATLDAAEVEVALAAGDLDAARDASGRLDEAAGLGGGPGLDAIARAARGAVALAEGRPEEALPPLRAACRSWRELDVPYEAARAGVLLARTYAALGDTEAAQRELAAAVPVFDRLGARVDRAAADDLLDARPRPGGLSDREVEVLRLVADGRSNPQIAEALFISRKTVARHLSNIFAKLGVSSRTEAARFAFDHGLVPGRD